MKRTLIKNARIINEGEIFEGSLVIEGEIIAEILRNQAEPAIPCQETIDARFHYLLPGIIDDHVHFREPGLTQKADIFSESKAAVAGGVTSIMDMPNVIPQTTSLEALEEKFKLGAEKSLVNYSFYFGATNDNLEQISQLDPQKVCGIKLFMGSSTGNMLVDRIDAIKKLFTHTDLLIAAHCEDQSIIQHNTELFKQQYGEDPGIHYHPYIRSEEACFASSSLAVKLAKETGARLHLLHITTEKELTLLENLPVSEKKITAEVCIPHLLFSQEDYDTLGSRIKCNPAIKKVTDRDALRKALHTHIIDVIGTDHAPHLPAEKEGGSLKAVSGMPMIQFSLISMMELVKAGVISLEQVVQKMCHTPAELYQLHKRGFIREGYQADLVLLNPQSEWTLSNSHILSKCGWSPLEGKKFSTRVEKTFINGQLIYNEGTIADSYRGQALQFRRT